MSIVMPRENNKAGWQPLPNKFYEISVGDIQKYLEDPLTEKIIAARGLASVDGLNSFNSWGV